MARTKAGLSYQNKNIMLMKLYGLKTRVVDTIIETSNGSDWGIYQDPTCFFEYDKLMEIVCKIEQRGYRVNIFNDSCLIGIPPLFTNIVEVWYHTDGKRGAIIQALIEFGVIENIY